MSFFGIKSYPGVTYNSLSYKKSSNIVLKSSEHEERVFPYAFIFVFIPILLGGGVIIKVMGLKKDKKGVSIEDGFKPAHYA